MKKNIKKEEKQLQRNLFDFFFLFFVLWLYDDSFGHFLSYYFRSVSITTWRFRKIREKDKKVNEEKDVFVEWRIVKLQNQKKKECKIAGRIEKLIA